MMSKVRTTMIGVAAAAALSSALIASPAAQASTISPTTTHITATAAGAPTSVRSASECGDYPHVCLWADKDYNTGYGAWAQSVDRLPSALWNKVSSFWNRLPGKVVFYTVDNRAGGATFCVDPGGYWDDLSSSATAGWNDNIQSFSYYPGGRC